MDGSCKISQAVKHLADVGALRVGKLLLFLWLHDRESVWKHDRKFLGSLKTEHAGTHAKNPDTQIYRPAPSLHDF